MTACFGTFWQLATAEPQKPLVDDLAKLMEIYRAGECRREVPPDLWDKR